LARLNGRGKPRRVLFIAVGALIQRWRGAIFGAGAVSFMRGQRAAQIINYFTKWPIG
jgi:hypothetical protein